MLDRILVGFDGSREARRACQVATELAGQFHSALTLLVVRETNGEPVDPVLESLVPFDHDGRALASLLDEIRQRATSRGAVRVETVVLGGDVLEVLLGWLEQNPQDLVVVGSRSRSRGRRLFLGSVSAGLVNEAPCPVLVVRGASDRRGRSSAAPAPPAARTVS